METRYYTFRSDGMDGDRGQIRGVALPYGVKDSYDTIFDAGCVSNASGKVKLHRSHNPDTPIGFAMLREGMGSLEYDAEVFKDLPEVLPTWEMIKRGLFDGVSIGFDVKDSYYDPVEDCVHFRRIEIMELSVVSIPAVPGATITEVRGKTMQTRKMPSFMNDQITDDDILGMSMAQISSLKELIKRIETLTGMTLTEKTDPNAGVPPTASEKKDVKIEDLTDEEVTKLLAGI